MFTGVLPGRASELDDTLEWLTQRLGAVQPQHQTIVRRYAMWHVLRRAKGRPHRPATRHHARERLLLALRLLSWLEAEGHGLQELSQSGFDRWLANGPPARVEIRDFISWAHRPVSYTHLDVYKRQVPRSSWSRRSARGRKGEGGRQPHGCLTEVRSRRCTGEASPSADPWGGTPMAGYVAAAVPAARPPSLGDGPS